ncbi:MAG TPA: galactose oxidase-like domain-containing protein [Gemmatimonadales bacterium]|jgi:hypothetical protein|nr:galactose oxidase-like domain-containing protein [Gemmatimonadales bacterium]
MRRRPAIPVLLTGALIGLVAVWYACGNGDLFTGTAGPPPPPPPPSLVGAWLPRASSPIVQVHLHLLRNGKVLSWPRVGDPQVWDPATGSFTPVPAPSWLFCAGHDWLPDGRLLVAGGHIADLHGLPNTNIFDPATGTWSPESAMAKGRWYPTNTTLPDGEVLTLAGTDQAGAPVPIPEVWNGTGWRQLTGASLELPYYPRSFVAPDGRVFVAGEDQQSRYLDVTGLGHWTAGPVRLTGPRDYGSAVMYAPGKILYVGGGDPPMASAEIIDLNVPNPQWRMTTSMHWARRQMDATLLPTGDVLVTGGTLAPGFNNYAGGLVTAEIWSPTTGGWSTTAYPSTVRMYHGTALLLPDARVLYSGSGGAPGTAIDELNYEVFQPPYLFKGPRPTITGTLPGRVGYGSQLVVQTPDGASIAKVNLIRLSSVTHAFDMGARLVPLSFTTVSGGLTVGFPTSRADAPPGPYMLFLVNTSGVPSIAPILLLN